jgi:hypothetical protein
MASPAVIGENRRIVSCKSVLGTVDATIGEDVEQSQDRGDRDRGVPHNAGDAEAEQRQESKVEGCAEARPQRRLGEQGRPGIPAGGGEPVAGQDPSAGDDRAEHAEQAGAEDGHGDHERLGGEHNRVQAAILVHDAGLS